MLHAIWQKFSLTAFLLLLNVIFYGVYESLTVFRAVVNIEYVVVLLIALWSRPFACAFLLFWVIPHEVMPLLGLVMQGAGLMDMLGMLSFIRFANAELLALFGLVVTCIPCIAWAVIKLPIARYRLLTVALPLIGVFFVNGMYESRAWHANPHFDFRGSWIEPYLENGMFVAAHSLQQQYKPVHLSLRTAQEVAYEVSGSNHAFIARNELPDKLLLIVNESWGVALNPDLQQEIVSPIFRNNRFEITGQGQFPAGNLTVVGELRELCVQPKNSNQKAVFSGDYTACLPNALSNLGYRSYAFHAAPEEMYDRDTWYAKAGFNKISFYEDIVWPRKCYSFPGGCDVDLVPEIAKVMGDDQKQFIYWLTLNSHYPYDKRDILPDYPLLNCETYQLQGDSCVLARLQQQFFFALADLLSSERADGFYVRVVGDHSPYVGDPKGFAVGLASWVEFAVKPTQRATD